MTDNEIQVFEFEGQMSLRSVIREGEPWFIASDVAKVLEHSNSRAMVSSLDEDEKGVMNAYTPSGEQDMTVINESGLYSVVLRSRVEGAKRFKKWVTSEVLPSIRKHGAYMTADAIDAVMADPDNFIRLVEELRSEREAKEAAQEALEAAAPKVDAYDAFMDAEGLYSINAVAKILGTGQNTLFADLRRIGVLQSEGAGKNTPYQQWMRHFEVKVFRRVNRFGDVQANFTTKVKPSGIDFIRKKIREGKYV